MTAVSIPPTASAAAFAEYMRQAGRRCTPERFLVLSAAESLQGHFTARVVADVLQRNSTHVSMATVYSTMQMLVDCGMLRKLYIDNAATVYEMAMACHKHLVCTKCGKIKKMKDPEFDEMLRKRRFQLLRLLMPLFRCMAFALRAHERRVKQIQNRKTV